MSHAPNALPLPRTGEGAVVRTLLLAQHALFVVLVVAGIIRSWQQDHNHAVLWGAIALAVWYIVGVWLGLRSTSRTAALWWLFALSAGWVALVLVSPEFIWVAFALFFLYLHLLPTWWGYAAVLAVLAVSIGAQLPTAPGGILPQIVGPVFGAAVAVGMSQAYQRLVAENNHRLALVRELETANANLLALQDELARMQREAGVWAERTRLARDIHDTLAQGFSSILLLARASNEPENVSHIAEVAQENLDAARRVVHELQPRELQEAPLPAALERLVTQLRQQTKIDADCTISGSPITLPTIYEVTLLRVAQSALANVRQHAGATTAHLGLVFAPSQVHLSIMDDGRGFDPASLQRAGSYGLQAMEQRVVELGGDFSITSEPGAGVEVHVTLPVRGEQ